MSDRRTPQAPAGLPPSQRRSKNTVSNPRFKSGNRNTDSSALSNLTPIEEIFPSRKNSKNLQRKRRTSTNKENEGGVKSPSRNPVYDEEEEEEEHGKMRAPMKSFEKVKNRMKIGREMLSTEFHKTFDNDSIDPDEIEEIDYEERLREIEDLPFYEQMLAKKVPGRICIAFTAVSLIWLTSLALINAIVGDLIFPSQSLTETSDAALAYFDRMNGLRDGYASCALSEQGRCRQDISNVVDAEKDRTGTLLDANDAYLALFEENRVQAKTILNQTVQLFRGVGAIDPEAVIRNGIIFNQDCPEVNVLIQTSIATSSALTRQQQVQQSTDASVDALIANFGQHANFSRQFWEDNQQVIDDFNAQLALEYENGAAAIQDNLDQTFAGIQSCFQTEDCNGNEGLAAILNRFDSDSEEEAGDKQGAFDDLDVDVQSFVDTLNNVIEVAERETIPLNLDPREIDSIDLEAFVDNNEALNRIDGALDSAFDDVGQAIDDIESDVEASAQQFGNDVLTLGSENLEPYNPPEVNEDIKTQYDEDQEARNEELLDDIILVNQGQGDADSFVEPSPKSANPTEFADGVISQFEDRDLDLFAYDVSVFNSIEAGLNAAFSAAIYADVIFRLVLTFLTINKYWNLSSIGKPPGDCRVNELIGRKFGTKKTIDQKLTAILTHPALLNGLVMIFVIVLTTLIYAIYDPFYSAYIETCVSGSVEDIRNETIEGTMIFRNVFSASVTFSSEQGDNLISTTIDQINTDTTFECESQTVLTIDRLEDQVDLFNAINNDYFSTKRFRDEFVECIDLAQLEDAVPPGTYDQNELNDDSFFFDTSPDNINQDAIFDCSAFEFCDIQEVCQGDYDTNIVPDIEEDSFVFSCDSEQFLHATVLSFLLIIVIYVTMFIFRKNFMRALVRLLWREINPYDFNILATCLRDGQHIDPERVTENGFTFQNTATIELHKALRSWERESWVYLILALSLHFPWLFAAIFLSEGVQAS